MLARRIIPCLDVRNGRVVKGKQFEDIIDVDDPASLGEYYSKEGADELVFYDITASHEERETSLAFVKEVASRINIPFSVGGGVSTIEDFKTILRSGADKVSINSSAVRNPSLIYEASRVFGSQCVVLSIDAKKNDRGTYDVYVNGGRKNTGIDALSWAIIGEKLGAGEIVLNSMDQDGMKNGFDTKFLKLLTSSINIPVIASGGAGTKEHFKDAALAGADGILAASVFHFNEIKISDLKQYLINNNVEMRK